MCAVMILLVVGLTYLALTGLLVLGLCAAAAASSDCEHGTSAGRAERS